VVGAGFAGLSAAFQLVQQGHRVTVLERASRAGGRAAAGESDTDPIAARVSTADHALHALVRAAGLAHEFLPVRPVRSAFVRGGHFVPIPSGGDPCAVARIPGVRFLDALRLVLGPDPESRYKLGYAHVDRGATLALYSDGVFERGMTWGDPFGMKRVHKWLKETRKLSAEDAVRDLMKRLGEYCPGKPYEDDVTVLVARRLQ
jgi:hypothetical protein